MFALYLLLGCSFGLAPTAGSESATSTAETRIDELLPKRGPPAGGTAVTITGAGFVGEVLVTFGGASADVTVIDDTTLAVTTPRVSSEATVDVKVVSDNGADTLFSGFTFTRAATTDDTGSTDDTGRPDDTDTTPSLAGMVAGFVTYDYSDLACPLCFGLAADNPPTVTATALFHAPADGSWLSWLPADGACVSEPVQTPLATTYQDAGTSVTLTDGTNTVTLTGTAGSSGTTYAATGLTASTFTQGVDWDMALSGGADIAAVVLPGALHTPLAITSVDPGSILTENPSNAYGAGFNPTSGTTLGWSPSGTGDFVIVQLDASSGGAYVGTASCRGADTGSLAIPASVLAGWSVGTQLVVRIIRYDVSEVVLPSEPSLELVSRFEVIGTGSVRN